MWYFPSHAVSMVTIAFPPLTDQVWWHVEVETAYLSSSLKKHCSVLYSEKKNPHIFVSVNTITCWVDTVGLWVSP